jgi:hypothetical protein
MHLYAQTRTIHNYTDCFLNVCIFNQRMSVATAYERLVQRYRRTCPSPIRRSFGTGSVSGSRGESLQVFNVHLTRKNAYVSTANYTMHPLQVSDTRNCDILVT